MTEKGYDGAVLGRRDNFAWFTFGGDNKIFRSTDVGYGLLAVTMDQVFLVAQTMDADRIYDDELAGLDVEVVSLKWFEETREQKAMSLLKGRRVVSDLPIPGADYRFDDFVALHTPYTPWEIQRYRQIGRRCDQMMKDIADAVEPGMTEQEIAARILYEYGREYMVPKVLLVGSDERIAKYRHPNASDKRLEKLLLLHAAADRFGLHCIITRMVSFGDGLSQETAEKYELLNQCLAVTSAMLRPGMELQAIIDARMKLLERAGMGQEYENHYPGASTGYFMGNSEAIIRNERVRETQCFDWFITVTGAKVEETVMAGPEGGEVLSAGGAWPVKAYTVGAYTCQLPTIYRR